MFGTFRSDFAARARVSQGRSLSPILASKTDLVLSHAFLRYSGLYPPPYGPSSSSTSTPTSSSFLCSISSLREFHLSRLLTYAQDRATWSNIDWICFETIPLVREALAIRLAMRGLEETLDRTYGPGEGRKQVWMAFVFPGGNFPDGSTVEDVVGSSVLPEPWGTRSELSFKDKLQGEDGTESSFSGRLPIPDAIGINCTSPAHIRQLGREFTRYLGDILTSGQLEKADESIGFVLYPDGGLVYDTTTRSWSVPTGVPTAGQEGGNWATNVAMVAREVGESTRTTSSAGGAKGEEKRVWGGGVLVGGCCKNGFGEIRGLRNELKPQSG